MAKIYTVVKDGEELETLKTLTAAKKLADTEGAEVYSDGKCVYQGTVETVPVETGEEPVEEEPVAEIVTAEPVVARKDWRRRERTRSASWSSTRPRLRGKRSGGTPATTDLSGPAASRPSTS